MNSDPAGPRAKKWTWMRWTVLLVIVFAAHVALIFMFGERKPKPAPNFEPTPSLTLAGDSTNEWLALNDATLFALPDRNGFAGAEWIALPPLSFQRPDWTEPPRWLSEAAPLPSAGFGAHFDQLVQTSRLAAAHLDFNQPPSLYVPEMTAPLPLPANSTMKIEGAVATRQLLTPLKLPAWPASDVIAPSVVQVLVDAAGNVLSAVLLPPENYLEQSAAPDHDADRWAVAVARAARFAPLTHADLGLEANPTRHLDLGQLVFNWQSVPMTETNGPE